MSSISLSRASRRLRSWVRCRLAMMTITPSRVSRRPAKSARRALTASGNVGECLASKRSCTDVATLLTFCPPGPDAHTKLSSISASSIAMRSVIRIMALSKNGKAYRTIRFLERALPGRQHLGSAASIDHRPSISANPDVTGAQQPVPKPTPKVQINCPSAKQCSASVLPPKRVISNSGSVGVRNGARLDRRAAAL